MGERRRVDPRDAMVADILGTAGPEVRAAAKASIDRQERRRKQVMEERRRRLGDMAAEADPDAPPVIVLQCLLRFDCPFCGCLGARIDVDLRTNHYGDVDAWTVQCPNEDCGGRIEAGTPMEAFRRWNRRHADG